eukprot:TRINITY_DN76_c0_g2_i4.p2 TRINITY_DN76_c0_g2~~TRINITY_DN76_c0_g2_i4.p2  ORF type:complete len:113 (+),score=22.79 TRINITY_DN76_c0_g2_i4:1062-1400(+)
MKIGIMVPSLDGKYSVDLQLSSLEDVLATKEIVLEVEPAAKDFILKVSYDPSYGARPLRRYIEQELGTEISKLIIEGVLSENMKVVIGEKGEKLTYAVKKNEDPVPRKRVKK